MHSWSSGQYRWALPQRSRSTGQLGAQVRPHLAEGVPAIARWHEIRRCKAGAQSGEESVRDKYTVWSHCLWVIKVMRWRGVLPSKAWNYWLKSRLTDKKLLGRLFFFFLNECVVKVISLGICEYYFIFNLCVLQSAASCRNDFLLVEKNIWHLGHQTNSESDHLGCMTSQILVISNMLLWRVFLEWIKTEAILCKHKTEGKVNIPSRNLDWYKIE